MKVRDAWVSPLLEVERAVQERAKAIFETDIALPNVTEGRSSSKRPTTPGPYAGKPPGPVAVLGALNHPVDKHHMCAESKYRSSILNVGAPGGAASVRRWQFSVWHNEATRPIGIETGLGNQRDSVMVWRHV
jgi:hypothetical protein